MNNQTIVYVANNPLMAPLVFGATDPSSGIVVGPVEIFNEDSSK